MRGIDETDLAILKALEEVDSPMWKKDVHRTIQNSTSLPPEVAGVSVQTIGRRIDTLHDAGLLDPCIVTPENINRDLIIAYETTEKGKAVLENKREKLLREEVYTPIRLKELDEETRIYLADLFASEVGVDGEDAGVLEELDGSELSALVTAYYFQKDLENVLGDEGLADLGRSRSGTAPLQSLVDWLRDLVRKSN